MDMDKDSGQERGGKEIDNTRDKRKQEMGAR